MALKQRGHGEIVIEPGEHLVQPRHLPVGRIVGGEGPVLDMPARAVDGLRCQPGLGQQLIGHRRLAMDEFSAGIRSVAEGAFGERMDTAAATIAGFEDGYFPAGGDELARRDQARSAGPDDDDMISSLSHGWPEPARTGRW